MTVQCFASGPLDTNGYVVSCPETGKAAIIDVPFDVEGQIISYLREKKLTPDKIILTHSHWDHFGGLAALRKEIPVPVYVHAADAPNIVQPGADGLPLLFPVEGHCPEHQVTEGDEIPVGNLSFRVIHTPGHSPGGICLYCEEKGILFSGDTLFKGTIGSLSLPTARAEDMWHSLKKLAALPPETKVYPGHGGETVLRREGYLKNAEEIFS